MSEEISLSLEETNKLRINAGLPPIPTPQPNNDAEEEDKVISLSIEETNKLRQQIGLPLLPITTITNLFGDDIEYKNYENYEKKQLQELENNQLLERINNAKFNTNKRKFLTNNTLIDDNDNEKDLDLDLDTDDWLNNLGKTDSIPKLSKNKKQKVVTGIAKPNKYNESSEIIIGHSIKELRSLGNNEILTLKDSNILNDEEREREREREREPEDILINQDLSNKATLKRNLTERKEAENIKFNGRHYRRNNNDNDNEEEEKEEEEEDFDDNGLLINDKVIMSGSTIDLSKPIVSVKDKKKNMMTITNLFEDLDNDDDDDNNVKSNVPIKMKKIKKKKDNIKKKLTKYKLLDVTIKPNNNDDNDNNDNIDDDIDDIENQLSNSISSLRTKKLQTRSEFTPEQLAEEISTNKRWEFEKNLEQENLKNNVLYNDTIGFLNNLESNILSESGEVEMITNTNESDNEQQEQEQEQDHAQEQDHSQEQDLKQIIDKLDSNVVEEKQKNDEIPKFNGGLAETLKFLKSHNIFESTRGISTITNQELRQQELAREEVIKKSELLKMKISIEERILKEELNKDKSYIRMPKIERSRYFEKLLDIRLKQKGIIIDNDNNNNKRNLSGMVQNNLKIYNPKVELTYKDELGNVLNTKQAYKQLSHKYHGTGLDKTKKKQEQMKKKKMQKGKNSTTTTTVTERIIN